MIRSGNKVLAQIVKRISELNYIESKMTLPPRPDDVPQIQCGTRNDSFYITYAETVVKVLSITEDKHIYHVAILCLNIAAMLDFIASI